MHQRSGGNAEALPVLQTLLLETLVLLQTFVRFSSVNADDSGLCPACRDSTLMPPAQGDSQAMQFIGLRMLCRFLPLRKRRTSSPWRGIEPTFLTLNNLKWSYSADAAPDKLSNGSTASLPV